MPGGRPRDPGLTDRVITVATRVLATVRMPGFTSDEIAEAAGVGKASLYRRWPSLDDLLADVIANLGVRDVDYGHGPGEARADVVALLTAATTGPRALAEAAVLCQVGVDAKLRDAYARGPIVRFFWAVDVVQQRARDRGEAWVMPEPLLAGWSSLLYRVATTGQQPSLDLLADTVDHVVMPALRATTAAPVPAGAPT